MTWSTFSGYFLRSCSQCMLRPQMWLRFWSMITWIFLFVFRFIIRHCEDRFHIRWATLFVLWWRNSLRLRFRRLTACQLRTFICFWSNLLSRFFFRRSSCLGSFLIRQRWLGWCCSWLFLRLFWLLLFSGFLIFFLYLFISYSTILIFLIYVFPILSI